MRLFAIISTYIKIKTKNIYENERERERDKRGENKILINILKQCLILVKKLYDKRLIQQY